MMRKLLIGVLFVLIFTFNIKPTNATFDPTTDFELESPTYLYENQPLVVQIKAGICNNYPNSTITLNQLDERGRVIRLLYQSNTCLTSFTYNFDMGFLVGTADILYFDLKIVAEDGLVYTLHRSVVLKTPPAAWTTEDFGISIGYPLADKTFENQSMTPNGFTFLHYRLVDGTPLDMLNTNIRFHNETTGVTTTINLLDIHEIATAYTDDALPLIAGQTSFIPIFRNQTPFFVQDWVRFNYNFFLEDLITLDNGVYSIDMFAINTSTILWQSENLFILTNQGPLFHQNRFPNLETAQRQTTTFYNNYFTVLDQVDYTDSGVTETYLLSSIETNIGYEINTLINEERITESIFYKSTDWMNGLAGNELYIETSDSYDVYIQGDLGGINTAFTRIFDALNITSSAALVMVLSIIMLMINIFLLLWGKIPIPIQSMINIALVVLFSVVMTLPFWVYFLIIIFSLPAIVISVKTGGGFNV